MEVIKVMKSPSQVENTIKH